MDLVGAVGVFIILQTQAAADRLGQFGDTGHQLVFAVGFAAVDFQQRPGRARLLQQIHDVGVHLQDLDAVGDDVLRIRAQYHELVGMHHQPDATFGRTPARAAEGVLEFFQDRQAERLIGEREDRRRHPVQPDAFALAVAQRVVERLDIVAVDVFQRALLAFFGQVEQALARQRAIPHLFRDGDADKAEVWLRGDQGHGAGKSSRSRVAQGAPVFGTRVESGAPYCRVPSTWVQ
jgi:hypothetical protein